MALLAVGAVLVVCAGAAGALLLFWPQVRIEPDGSALARVVQPGYAGHVSRIAVSMSDGRAVPVRLSDGRLWPGVSLPVGEELTVELTVRRPGWAGWLVGRTTRRAVVLRTPEARVSARVLEIPAGRPVTVSFDAPVQLVELRVSGVRRTLRLTRARAAVAVGVVARGSQRAGSVTVSAVPRAWEQLPRPSQVSWFPAGNHAQALVDPRPGGELAPGRPISLTFSRPVQKVLGAALPTITPAVAGRWRLLDSHTLSFQPARLGYPLGAHLEVRLPSRVAVAEPGGERLSRTLGWQVPHGTVLRLHQLLAEAGYLPLGWSPSAAPVARSPQAQLGAAVEPPAGRFRWLYSNTPRELRALWRTGRWNEITRGAVMMFEHTHGLDVDGFVGPKVWHGLLADTLAARRKTDGYSYVYVHRSVPQSLTLWHDGRTILRSPGNTGVPAAPTQLGSFPVFEHIPIGTMSGTNPDGSRYHDPGIRYISYFNHGDAIHAFNRSSFGTPQSLGCVELPLAAAARVWLYTPIGTLVTIEN